MSDTSATQSPPDSSGSRSPAPPAQQEYVVLRTIAQRRSDGTPTGDFRVDQVELDHRGAAELAQASQIEAVAPVMPLRLHPPLHPTAGVAGGLNADGSVTWGVAAVGADEAAVTGRGATVAVIDTGIKLDHPAFEPIVDRIERRNLTDDTDDDIDGHGTHCAGTIFGHDVDGVRIGVAPGIERALIAKVFDAEGRASTKNLVEAIRWAVGRGANVISMSLGMDFPGFVERLTTVFGFDQRVAVSKALEGYLANVNLFTVLAESLDAGQTFFQTTTVVAATGNESERTALPPVVLGAAPPSTAKGFTAVGAIGRTTTGTASFALAPFSNAGPACVAPGVDVVSAGLNRDLVSLSGTSMATPHAAGLLALWYEQLSSNGTPPTNDELVRALLASGDRTVLAESARDEVGVGLARAPG